MAQYRLSPTGPRANSYRFTVTSLEDRDLIALRANIREINKLAKMRARILQNAGPKGSPQGECGWPSR